MPLTFDEFLALFPEKPRARAGKGWLVLCPGHNDHDPSLWVRPSDNTDFIATWDCQAGSCKREDILKALKLSWDDVRRNGQAAGGPRPIGKPRQPVNPPPKQARSKDDSPRTTPATGVTLSVLAQAKRLPVDYLGSLGVSDFKLGGLPVVRIPYTTEDGQETAVRFRLALTATEGTRFKWRKADHPIPYGLSRLSDIRKAGWVLLVEGESDCWTCWHYGLPALGAPGKSVWPTAWGEYLKGFDVYVWQEPDASDFTLRIVSSAPRCRFIEAPPGTKDISEAHIQGIDIPPWLESLKSTAEYGEVLRERSANAQMATSYNEARHIIEARDPLESVAEAIRGRGYGGDLKPAFCFLLKS